MRDIIVIGDFHWDAMDAIKQYNESYWVINFIDKVPNLDLVVIAGDYFNCKMLLNSKASLLSIQWMDSLYKICKKRNVKIRIIKGTSSHDNNQLDAFKIYQDENTDMFKIIRECTSENVFSDLKCLFCPDENIQTSEYMDKYHDILFSGPYDAMFFHGSFDVVVPNIALQESEVSGMNNIIYKYDFFEDICMVMIGGHWHDGDNYKHMFYTRSLNRWAFNEDNDKGFIYLTIDSDNHKYLVQRVNNPFTDTYKTFSVNTIAFKSIDDYHNLITDIDEILENDKKQKIQIRIKINIGDDKVENDNGMKLLKHRFMNEKRVKIVLRNMMTLKKRKETKEKNDAFKAENSYILDKNKSVSEIVQEFILQKKGKNIPLEIIEKYIDKIIKEK